MAELFGSGGGFAGYSAGGALPFGGSGGIGGAASGDPNAIAANYDRAYNNALAMNQSNYNNILAGYQQSLAKQTSAQQAIQAGYSGLYNDVMARINGEGESRRQGIDRASAQSLAKSSQQLIDRGLGNSTIQTSVNRGVEADRNFQQLNLSDQLARQSADYMSRLGLAGLSSQQRGEDAMLGQFNRQLDFMNSVTAKYPDAGMYGQLAMQAGQAKAAERNAYQTGGGAFAGNPGPRAGYVPSNPYYGSGFATGTPSGGGMNSGVSLMTGYGGVGGGFGMAAAASPDSVYGGGGGDWGAWEGLDKASAGMYGGDAKGFGTDYTAMAGAGQYSAPIQGGAYGEGLDW